MTAEDYIMRAGDARLIPSPLPFLGLSLSLSPLLPPSLSLCQTFRCDVKKCLFQLRHVSINCLCCFHKLIVPLFYHCNIYGQCPKTFGILCVYSEV